MFNMIVPSEVEPFLSSLQSRCFVRGLTPHLLRHIMGLVPENKHSDVSFELRRCCYRTQRAWAEGGVVVFSDDKR